MIEDGNQRLEPPPPPDDPRSRGNPWEQRRVLGYGAGLLENIKLFVTNPSAAYERTLKRGDFFSPLLFGVIVGWFGAIVGQIWQFLFKGAILNVLPPEVREGVALYMTTTTLSLAINMILTPIFLVVAMFIWSLVHHVSLMLVGALSDSDSGFEGTFRVNGYAHVVQLAAIVPFLGWLISVVWYITLLTIGAARLHDTTPGRALLGALLPLVACCFCFGIMFALFGAMLASALQLQ